MNEVFLIGKIVTNIEFKFIINSKKQKSIAIFKLETLDKQIIKIKAYNELADFVYGKLKKEDKVFVYGSLEENSINLKYISILS